MHKRRLWFAASLCAVECLTIHGCGGSGSGKDTASTSSDAGDAQAADAAEAAAEAAPDDGSSDAAPEAGPLFTADGAPICAPPTPGQCGTCTATNCCAELSRCNNELSDGGPTVCQSIQSCVNDCLMAGMITSTLPGCSLTCSQPYGTNPKVADFNALMGCQQDYCGMYCL